MKNKNDFEKNLESEYENYKKSLLITKDCPVCSFTQGLLSTGGAFFIACYLQEQYSKIKKTRFLFLSFISLSLSAFGLYKFHYTYNINLIREKTKLKILKNI